jgi:hypothetical protein
MLKTGQQCKPYFDGSVNPIMPPKCKLGAENRRIWRIMRLAQWLRPLQDGEAFFPKPAAPARSPVWLLNPGESRRATRLISHSLAVRA